MVQIADRIAVIRADLVDRKTNEELRECKMKPHYKSIKTMNADKDNMLARYRKQKKYKGMDLEIFIIFGSY